MTAPRRDYADIYRRVWPRPTSAMAADQGVLLARLATPYDG